ncbi:MAG: glycine cleavage system aminomethyltransferase GcvT [Thermincolia bacterium]
MAKETLRKTPLNEKHRFSGAKMVDFGGWEMPVQYSGILEEHRAVRDKAGLFDVSHMGEIDVQGPDALKLVNKVITNDATKQAVKQILYSPMCYANGGVVDDLLVYKLAEDHYYLVVNASNTDKDFQWLIHNAQKLNVQVVNLSAQMAQIALQGPKAQEILQKLTDYNLTSLKYYWFDFAKVDGVACLVSRTGYTGEDGFEIYVQPEFACQLWDKILDAGKVEGILPIGLGARDTLRFEARLPLYGQELSSEITPWEAGLGTFVKLDKEDFIGKAALVKQKQEGRARQLVGFEMVERGIPRSHYPITMNDREIGWVSSGSYAPSLDKNIGLGFVESRFAPLGTEIEVVIRGKGVKAKVIKTPFYQREA